MELCITQDGNYVHYPIARIVTNILRPFGQRLNNKRQSIGRGTQKCQIYNRRLDIRHALARPIPYLA